MPLLELFLQGLAPFLGSFFYFFVTHTKSVVPMARKTDDKTSKTDATDTSISVDKKNNRVMARVNPKVYPLSVVYPAAYSFIDRAFVLLDGDPEDEVVVTMIPKNDREDLETLAREFYNEMLNYGVYLIQSTKNQVVRDLILQRVLATNSREYPAPIEQDFSQTTPSSFFEEVAKSVEQEASRMADYLDDPEGIARPWSEKAMPDTGRGSGTEREGDENND